MIRKFIRYVFILPIGIVYMPVFALAFWMSPIVMYKDFFSYLKSGESFGVFD